MPMRVEIVQNLKRIGYLIIDNGGGHVRDGLTINHAENIQDLFIRDRIFGIGDNLVK